MKHIIYDDDNEIALCKMYEFFAQLLEYAIHNNGDGEILLRKSGLSSLCSEYELTPYSYNGQWQNANVQYNPKKVFFEIYPELDDKHKFIFIKNIIESVNTYKFNSTKAENFLSLLGYSLENSSETYSKWTIMQSTKGVIERGEDITLLERKLKDDFPDVFRVYDEALSTFGNGEYKSCIDNCRTIFEKITEALKGKSDDQAILSIAKEQLIDGNNTLTSKRKIYEYWLNYKKGANRYRYFTTLYSIMSGLGTHGEEPPQKADAVLILRAIEDVLVWILEI